MAGVSSFVVPVVACRNPSLPVVPVVTRRTISTLRVRLSEIVAVRVCGELWIRNDERTEHEIDAWSCPVGNGQVEARGYELGIRHRRIEVDRHEGRRCVDRCDEA